MTDFATAEPLSTTIDTDPSPSASGGGQPTLSEPAEPSDKGPVSVREDLEHVFKLDDRRQAEAEKQDKAKDVTKTDEKASEPAPKSKDEAAPKAAKEANDPAEKAVEGEDRSTDEDKATEPEAKEQREGKRHIEPPAKMLPRAKEVWRNTPREVQAEVERITREHGEEIQRYQQYTQRYERIRDIDEMAASNGRDLRDSLLKVNQFENLMRTNPVAALNMALQEAGPRRPDGSGLTLFEVAQHIVSQGQQGYQQAIQQARQVEQPSEDPRVAQLQQRVAELEIETINKTVIEPFKANHPRYQELEQTIASFLNSDMIPRSLSVSDRLAAAYDMAERINPRTHVDPPASDDRPAPQPARRADDDFSGSKSIKSAPGGVPDEFEDNAKPGESTRDSIRAVMRRGRA